MGSLSSMDLALRPLKSWTNWIPPFFMKLNRGLFYLDLHGWTTPEFQPINDLSLDFLFVGIRDLELLDVDRLQVSQFNVVEKSLGPSEIHLVLTDGHIEVGLLEMFLYVSSKLAACRMKASLLDVRSWFILFSTSLFFLVKEMNFSYLLDF